LAARETRDGALALARLATPTQVELREGDDVEVVLGGVPAPTIRLWGVVSGFENADGALTVNAHRVEAAHFARQQFSRVDERGGYEIQLDAAGAHDVTVESRSGKLLAQRVDVAGPQQRLDLQLGVASIRGRALDSGGAPVARADVRLSSADETLARRSETDADGAFAFTALAPGTYELVARAPRGRTAGSRGLVGAAKRSGVALASGERVEDLELHFAAGAAIEVEVTAASGPLANARVRVADAAGRAPDVAPARWTDARGRTRIEGLPAGAWFVQALDERLACAWSGPIEVAAGATASARLELESGAVLEVEIAGLSEPGTWLVARDSRGLELAKTWTRAGSRQPASLGPLPLGRITLAADDERGHSRALELSIDAPRPPTVRLDLSR
jgi:hypothetical protein